MICCFGEILLRMSPELEGRWINESAVPVHIGGAELNVASALALWNQPVKYVTAMPDNYISREIIHDLAQKGIDCTGIHLSGERIGIYYLPKGKDLKQAGVIYDRAHSSFSELRTGMLDWDKVLEGCDWFHFSAISPALGVGSAELCREAVDAARSKGLTISLDLNYRSRLWQYGKEPVEIMAPLIRKADLVMGNLWAAQSLLGIQSLIAESQGKSKEELIEAAAFSMRTIGDHYPNVREIAYTFRLDHMYYAVLQKGNELVESREFFIDHVKDKVGSGDCFMAGLIYGWQNGFPPQKTLDFASAAAVGKLGEHGDATGQKVDTILKKISVE